MKPGLTIVVSPLLALMDDQIQNLTKRGIRAETLNSSAGIVQQRKIMEDLSGTGGKSEILKLSKLIKKRVYKDFDLTDQYSDFLALKDSLKNYDENHFKNVLNSILNLPDNLDVKESFLEFKNLVNTVKERSKPIKLLYIAPETLLKKDVTELIKESVDIAFIAIDESHIISSWGTSFRPKYVEIAKVREIFKPVPILALTATADPITRKDIVSVLKFNDDTTDVYLHPVDRPNISYTVIPKVEEYSQVLKIIRKYDKDTCGLIYCMTREKAENMKRFLTQYNVTCEFFHAGMSVADKKRIQEAYIDKSLNLIIATVAFGMGIDRSDVRYVINSDIPNSLEEFSQMSGRASRDGLPADSYLLYARGDANKAQWLLRQSVKNPERLSINSQKITKMVYFCETIKCRRANFLKYFGETVSDSYHCGNCDNCK